MKVSFDWLQDFIKMPPPAERIADHLTMAGLEVEKLVKPEGASEDMIMEVEVTTNRADWLSHIGIAREIAAVENLHLKQPLIDETKGGPSAAGWKIAIKESEGCPYYTGVLIEGITPAETPEFIKKRLETCGVRSIDLIVDITNYVLLETGQPLHAFDADLIRNKEVKIRRAKPGEKITAIDSSILELSKEDLVIADAELPIAIAGVMGGKDTEVGSRTRSILLESAFFNPRFVRKTSRKFNLVSESSYRFERRVDPEGVDFGRDRALYLIKKYAKPRFVSRVMKVGEKPLTNKAAIHLSSDDIERTLGISIKTSQVSSFLTRLGLSVSPSSQKGWKVKVPSFRPDLTRPVDLVEEVARIYSFEKIPETLPERAPIAFEKKPVIAGDSVIRNYLAGAGLYETVTFSLIARKSAEMLRDLSECVQIINPQHKELCWMRPSLMPSLLEVIQKNRHVGNHDVCLFEIAHSYENLGKGKHPREEKVVAIAICGNWKENSWLDSQRESTFYDLKGVVAGLLEANHVQQFSSSASANISWYKENVAESIQANEKEIGHMGEIKSSISSRWDIDSPVFYAEINIGALVKEISNSRKLVDLPRYPSTSRDLSVTVAESVKSAEIKKKIEAQGQGLIKRIEIFDIFRGGRIPKGFKNIGIRVVYQSNEKTLVSSDIQELHTSIADNIANTFKAAFQQ